MKKVLPFCIVLLNTVFVSCGYELRKKDEGEPIESKSVDAGQLVHDSERAEREQRRQQQQQLKAHLNRVKASIAYADVNKTFGGISNVLIQLDNPTPLTFDMVNVSVRYVLKNGSLYTTEYVTFDNVTANSTKMLKAPNCTRGVGVVAVIEQYSSQDLPPALNRRAGVGTMGGL